MDFYDGDVTLFYPADWQVTARAGHEDLLEGTMRWSVEQGIVQPGSSSHRSLERMRSDLATVLAYPAAHGEAAQFISDFIGWYLLLDDELESSSGHGEDDLRRMPALFDQYLDALTDPSAFQAPDMSGLLRGALDLGARVDGLASPAWQARFWESMRTYFYHGVLPEMTHSVRKTLPSLTEYTELRIDSSGWYPISDLIELSSGMELPTEVAAHRLVQEIRKVAAITISWANDILSFHKEQTGQRGLNLPFLLMSDCDLQEAHALRATAGIHNAEMRRYLSLKQEAQSVNGFDSAAMRSWLRNMDIVMRGLLEWQFLAARYTQGRSLAVRVMDTRQTPG